MTVQGGNTFGVLEESRDEGTSSKEALDDLLGDGLDEPTSTTPEVTPETEAPPTTESSKPTRIETAPPGDPDPNSDAQASGDGAAPDTEGLIWGRYKSLTDAHEGYKNMQRREERTAAERKTLEQELQRRDAIIQQMVQRMQVTGQVPEQQQAELDPLQIIQDRAREAAKAELEQVQAQAQAQERYGQVMQTIDQFRERYADAAEGSELDNLMGEIVNEFQTDADGKLDPDAFPMDSLENLEIAYVCAKNPPLYRMMLDLDLIPNEENLAIAHEAAMNPQLAAVLKATGVLSQDDPDGQLLNWARQMAGMPGQVQAVQVQAAQPNPQAMRRAAYVETGGTGAPVNGAPGARPMNEIDEAIAAYRSDRQDDNVFGI